MGSKEKILLSGLGLIGVVALTLGWFQLKNNLSDPFIGFKPMGTPEAERQLRNQDINILGSNYFSGPSEIEGNVNQSAAPTLPLSNSNTNTNVKTGASSSLNSNSLPLPGDLTNISTDTLRQYLKQAGASDQLISGLDDATLRQLYRQAASGSTDSSSLQRLNLSDSLLKEITNIPLSQVRDYLKNNGAPAAAVDSLSDDDLRKMLLSAGQSGQ